MVQDQQVKQNANRHHRHPIVSEQVLGRGERKNKYGQAQNKGNVHNIGAHHVSHADVRVAAEGRLHAHHQFGGRCTNGNNGHSHQGRWNLQPPGNGRRAPHQKIAPKNEQNQSTDDQNNGHASGGFVPRVFVETVSGFIHRILNLVAYLMGRILYIALNIIRRVFNLTDGAPHGSRHAGNFIRPKKDEDKEQDHQDLTAPDTEK